MNKRTIVDQVEITRTGVIQVRMLKQVVDTDGSVLAQQYHRTAIDAGGDIGAQFASVNAHLSSMGFPPLAPNDISRITNIAGTAWAQS